MCGCRPATTLACSGPDAVLVWMAETVTTGASERHTLLQSQSLVGLVHQLSSHRAMDGRSWRVSCCVMQCKSSRHVGKRLRPCALSPPRSTESAKRRSPYNPFEATPVYRAAAEAHNKRHQQSRATRTTTITAVKQLSCNMRHTNQPPSTHTQHTEKRSTLSTIC